MELKILLKANLKRHRAGLAGVSLLIFLVSLALCTVLTFWGNSGAYLLRELRRAGFGDLTAWTSGAPDPAGLAAELAGVEQVERVERQPVIYTSYAINGRESDSEGQLIRYAPEENRYRFFSDDLAGHREPPGKIPAGEVYISPSMASIFGARAGDAVTFPVARGGKDLTLHVAGFYEDPFMGSGMIGMKGFLVSGEDWEAARSILGEAGIDALAREGEMLHIFAEPAAGLTASELSARLNQSTSLPAHTEFVHSEAAIHGFMLVLQNAFGGFLLAFALVLLWAAMAALGHQIASGIEEDYVDMGILRTLGLTSGGLRRLQLAQYLTGILGGMLLGLVAAAPASRLAAAATLTTTGVLVPGSLALGLCLPALGGVLLALAGFLLWKLRGLDRVTPMKAIRGEAGQARPGLRRLPPMDGGRLELSLALRQLLTGGRRYAGACVVAALLVFFASLVGRLDSWLGPDGRGMMEAFNPAGHDIGVQSFGQLTREDFEQTIRAHTGITDAYVLAMPGVTVEGVDYTANVIDQPERFHMLEGRACTADNQVVVTEAAAADLGLTVGDRLTVGADAGSGQYVISGIYACANDMGRNIGMSREGYLKIGRDHPNLWCWHYDLDDPGRKPEIIGALEAAYGGDVHVHENTWPGLEGIILAMRALTALLYAVAVLFVLTVTGMTGGRILLAERRDMGIYKALGFPDKGLRRSFALRFGLAAAAGSAVGTALAALLTDPLVSRVMGLAGISGFASSPGLPGVLFPGAAVVLLFTGFAYLWAGTIKKTELAVLITE